MLEQDRQRLISERRTARGFFSDRYALIVAVFEVFFRKYMGERYFTFGVFIAAFIGLLALRFWLTLSDFWVFIGYDVFLIAYAALGAYHLYTQNSLVSKGIRIHSWYIGDSRFAPLGKYLNSKDPNFAAYVYIEPLIVFLLILPLLQYSLFLGVGAIIGGGRLWYQNWRTVRNHRFDELDREDGKIVASHASASLEDDADREVSSPPPIPQTAARPIPPPIPLMNNSSEELSPIEAMKRVKQKREQNKRENDENTFSNT